MKKVNDVLRLHYEANLSHRKIAHACGISKGIVSKYLALAEDRGIPWPLPDGWDESELEARLHPGVEKPARFIKPDFPMIHQELKRKGVTLQLLWSEYATAHETKAYRYSQFCHHYHQWRGRQKRSMRQVHKAGEKLFIDYCGPAVPVVDGSTGEIHQAQVFVAVLGASNYTYAEATWS